MKIAILVLLLIFCGSFTSSVFADDRNCKPDRICVFPNDFLKYSGVLGDSETITTTVFGDFVNENKIRYTQSGTYDSEEAWEDHHILDLIEGVTEEVQEDGSFMPFVVMSPIPIKYDKFESGVSESKFNYKNLVRTVIVSKNQDAEGSGELIFDKETGILLRLQLSATVDIIGETTTITTKTELLDTNIIGQVIKTQNEKQVIQEKIPEWIRNTALWWSDGKISDDEFINGIQFLINEEIIQVSAESKSNDATLPFVPNWIKDTAGWWGTKKVSDNDFLNGIKWLIENGILRV